MVDFDGQLVGQYTDIHGSYRVPLEHPKDAILHDPTHRFA